MAAPVAHGGSQARVKSELQLPAYASATATWDLSRICDLHHSSEQHLIFNPLSEARNGTHILKDTSQVCELLSHNGSVPITFFFFKLKILWKYTMEENFSNIYSDLGNFNWESKLFLVIG